MNFINLINRKGVFFSIIVSLITISGYSQNSICGFIKSNGNPVEFCSVVLLGKSDSLVVKGAFTDSIGRFEINDVDSNSYLLKAQLIGYEEYITKPFVFDNEQLIINLSIVELSTVLGEVQIVARKPLLEQKAGKMVVNVAENSTNIGGSLRDVLKKVPGLMVTTESVSVLGGGSTIILIDGLPTDYLDLNSLLDDIPSDNIDKIEVISQPGAEYAASGSGAIINVFLKIGKLNGFNGSFSNLIGYAKEFRYYSILSFNWRKDKFNLHGSIGYYNLNNFEGNIINRELGEYNYLSERDSPNRTKSLYPSLGVDYNFTKSISSGFNVSFISKKGEGVDNNLTTISLEDTVLENLTTKINEDIYHGYVSTSGYFKKIIDTNGQEINFNASYGYFTSTTFQLFDIFTSDKLTDNRENNGESNNYISAIKVDYKLPFNKNVIFDMGSKYSYATIKSDVQMFNTFTNKVKDVKFSNQFNFEESIKAVYLKSTMVLKKDILDGNVGLRWERSDSEGYSVDLDSSMNRTIDRIFPSFSLSYQFSKKFGTSVAYSQRIDRPSYSTLNPYTYFLDPFTFEKGNPFIGPEITNSYKMSFTFNKQPFLNFDYSKTKDAITLIVGQDESTGEGYAITKNLKSFENYGMSLYFPIKFFKNLDGYGGIMGNYNVYQSPDLLSNNNKLDKLSMTLFIEASYNITDDFEMGYNAWFNSGGLEGIMNYSKMWGMSLSADFQTLDDQLTFSINWSDFYNGFFNSTIAYQNVRATLSNSFLTNRISFRVKYNFGNKYLKKEQVKNEAGSEEIKRIN